MFRLLFGVISLLALGSVQAQPTVPVKAPCAAPPEVSKSSTQADTSLALNAVTKLLASAGFDIKYRTTRDSVLAEHPNADQMIVTLTMAYNFCQMIWSDDRDHKPERYQQMMMEILRPAAGPAPIARTGDKPGNSSAIDARIVLASADPEFQLAQAEPAPIAMPQPVTSGYLRDPPFYINNNNKHFVIVGSAPTEAAGRALLDRLKAKAGTYDFALYAPYGSNTAYGVMMASWVPWSVAQEALGHAKQEVDKGAYIWSCRSSGQSC